MKTARLQEVLNDLRRRLEGEEREALEQMLGEFGDVKAENERLHTRLEDNFCWQSVNGKWVKIAVEPGSMPDGIECRDETIRQLQCRLKE